MRLDFYVFLITVNLGNVLIEGWRKEKLKSEVSDYFYKINWSTSLIIAEPNSLSSPKILNE